MTTQNKEFFKIYDLLVISPGGSEQTAFMTEIEKQKPVGYVINQHSDNDNMKHISSPKSSLFQSNQYKRIIYVFNDTLCSIDC